MRKLIIFLSVLLLATACDSFKPKTGIVFEVKDTEFPFHLPLAIEQAKRFNPKAKIYVLDRRSHFKGLPDVPCKIYRHLGKLKAQMKRDLIGPRYFLEDNVLVYANLNTAKTGSRSRLGPGIELKNGWLTRGSYRAKFLGEKVLPRLFWSRMSDHAILPKDDSGKLICSLQLPRDELANYAANTLHASSSPFISGDSFRAIADHIYDDTGCKFHMQQVKKGDTIFVSTRDLPLFFSVVHPQLKVPYILITHNGIENVPGAFEEYLTDDNLVAWFGKNVTLDHPKMYPLPIGLANMFWSHGNVDHIRQVIGKEHQKDHLIYLNLWKVTCPGERELIYQKFEKCPETFVASKKPYGEFLTDLAHSSFVFSPRGTSLDCHRTWEAMLLGCIPIVKRSKIDKVYEDLPVMLIDDWKELTLEGLKAEEKRFKKRTFNTEKLYLPYYIKQIRDVQRKCR